MQITHETVLCGSLAVPNRSKATAAMYNDGFAAIAAQYVYLLFEPTNLQDAIVGLRSLNFRGAAVSSPFKRTILDLVDTVDAQATKIGAANTIVYDGEMLTAYNTDADGATAAMSEVVDIRNQAIALVGTGGTARAIAFGLRSAGADVHVLGRNRERIATLADDLDCRDAGLLLETTDLREYAAVVNATTLGSAADPQSMPVSKTRLDGHQVVMDVVFDPPETAFMRAARSRGCTVVSGLRMLVHQAALQIELFSGQRPPLNVLESGLARS